MASVRARKLENFCSLSTQHSQNFSKFIKNFFQTTVKHANYSSRMPEMNIKMSESTDQRGVRVEPATIEDLAELVQLVEELMSQQEDFNPDRTAHQRGLALILEQPNRGRIFVLRNDDRIFGMANLLFTISTAVGGLVILLEDFVIHPSHRGQGYGSMLLDYVDNFARKKNFKRITLLTDKMGADSQNFFKQEGFDYSHMVPMRKVIE